MKTATVRQLRTEFPKVLAWVNAGEEVAITRRRKVVANLILLC
jgi:antitoxin (DNA-binding transcriptional repressor) of toxin-antitoxin stability system